MHLACGQDEANGIAERIHAGTDLRAQAAARTPDRLIFVAPFAPAACWCARTMVESMIRYSKCGFRRLRPGIPIERGHAFRSKAATCSDEGGRGVVAGMRSWVRFSWLRQDWRVGQ